MVAGGRLAGGHPGTAQCKAVAGDGWWWLVVAGGGWQPLTSTSQHLPSLLQPWPLNLGHEEDQPGGGGDGPGVAGPGSPEGWWRWLVLADPVFWVS